MLRCMEEKVNKPHLNTEKGEGTQTASRTGAVVTLRARRKLAAKHKERTARADAAEKHGVRH
jgi:hypothetical protein